MSILVVAPHPDDETFGCGGALLRHREQNEEIHWLIVTEMKEDLGYSLKRIEERNLEINKVSEKYKFSSVHKLKYSTARLDTIALSDIVANICEVFKLIKPSVVYLPNRSDAHSDHRITHDAVVACCKWFRNSSVKKILAYETLSETDFDLSSNDNFTPNYYVNISDYIAAKKEIVNIYESELGDVPFPRSLKNIEALATLRGSTAGVNYAEAFMLLKEIF